MTTLNQPSQTELMEAYNCQMLHCIKQAQSLNEGSTTILDKFEGLVVTYKAIRKCLTDMSKGQPRYVVTETETSFSITRLVNYADIESAYSLIEPVSSSAKQSNDMTEPIELIKKLLDRYVSSELDKVQKYAPNVTQVMFSDKVFPYSYLQRNTSTAPCFKRAGPPTAVLKRSIYEMVESEYIEEVPKGKYGVTALLFKIK